MRITDNKAVALTYDLEVEGAIVDQVGPDQPLDYIHGMHMLLPKFEEAVEGLEPGGTFDFTLPPEDAYGPYEPKKRFDLPKASFTINGEVREDLMQPGKVVPMVGTDGGVIHATIVAVKPDGVTMDFNHPMAGKTLHFTGRILTVRDATDKELTEGLHGEFLPEEDCCCGHHHGGGHCHHGDGGDGCCHHHHGEGCCHHHED